MKTIELTKGLKTIVDDETFEWASKSKWTVTKSGNNFYAVRATKRNGKYRRIFLHREINKTPEGLFTDHINGDTLDNRKENLRTVTHKQNMINRKVHKDSQVKYKGVFLFKQNGKFVAQIKPNGKILHLGYFDTPEEAARVYDENAKKYFGEFAYLNFPEEKILYVYQNGKVIYKVHAKKNEMQSFIDNLTTGQTYELK